MKLSRILRRDPAVPTLRERGAALAAGLTAAKKRAVTAAKVARIVAAPPAPEPAPADRVALTNYASWLFMERRLVCAELYPHMGARADKFVIANNAADAFHFPPSGGFPGYTTTAPKPSTRAIAVLDLVGVDWRADLTESGRAQNDPPSMRDTGERPALPHGWPTPDAALLEALDDLNRLDAGQEAMHVGGADPRRDADTVPGYGALEQARGAALDRMAEIRAESLTGLQAKARAMLTPSVVDVAGGDNIARSLARDLLGIPQSAIEPQADPILPAIDECRRLNAIHGAALAISGSRPANDPSHEPEAEAYAALWGHWDGVVLKTVPTTARGCTALARYAVEFLTAQGVDERRDEILTLIARSPLL